VLLFFVFKLFFKVAVNCILPKEWKGVFYGGLEQWVMFIDLDCRLDVLRLVQLLKHRILVANRMFSRPGFNPFFKICFFPVTEGLFNFFC